MPTRPAARRVVRVPSVPPAPAAARRAPAARSVALARAAVPSAPPALEVTPRAPRRAALPARPVRSRQRARVRARRAVLVPSLAPASARALRYVASAPSPFLLFLSLSVHSIVFAARVPTTVQCGHVFCRWFSRLHSGNRSCSAPSHFPRLTDRLTACKLCVCFLFGAVWRWYLQCCRRGLVFVMSDRHVLWWRLCQLLPGVCGRFLFECGRLRLVQSVRRRLLLCRRQQWLFVVSRGMASEGVV
jgi:hypothetical protein